MTTYSTTIPGSGLPTASGPFIFSTFDGDEGDFKIGIPVTGDKIAPTQILYQGAEVSTSNRLPVSVNFEDYRVIQWTNSFGSVNTSLDWPLPVRNIVTEFSGQVTVFPDGSNTGLDVLRDQLAQMRSYGKKNLRFFANNFTNLPSVHLNIVEVITSINKVNDITVTSGTLSVFDQTLTVTDLILTIDFGFGTPTTGALSLAWMAE